MRPRCRTEDDTLDWEPWLTRPPRGPVRNVRNNSRRCIAAAASFRYRDGAGAELHRILPVFADAGVVAVNREIHHADVYAISRKEVPSPTQQQKSSVPDCDASNVALSLTPAASSFGVGGTMDFTASVKYNGSGKAGCLIDVSQAGMVLTIKSGKDVVWKSNVCPVDTDYRLIAKGDEVKQTITWPGVRSGSECADAADLPNVDRGVYSAQLSVKGHAKTKSEPVGITVE